MLRSTRILAAALGLTALAAAACSASNSAPPPSSQTPSSQTPMSSQAPEQKRATAAEVEAFAARPGTLALSLLVLVTAAVGAVGALLLPRAPLDQE